MNNTQLNDPDLNSNQNHYIPIQFCSDEEYYHIGAPLPFPRWKLFSSDDDNDDEGYDDDDDDDKHKRVPLQNSISIIDSLIHHIDEYSRYLSQFEYSLKYTDPAQYYSNRKTMQNDPNAVRTTDHSQDWTFNYLQPEILYVVDGEKDLVMTSQYALDVGDVDNFMFTWLDYTNVHKLINSALALLINNNCNAEIEKLKLSRWPRLYQLIVVKKGSFPYLAHYSDYVGCNYHNWNNHTESIPLFTLAASVNCNHTFPFITHTLNKDSKQNSNEWYDIMNGWKDMYPLWINKISKVVFRGQLSGYMPKNESERTVRWHLTKLVNNDESKLTPEQLNLFDVKLINEYIHFGEWIHPEEFGGFNNSHKMDFVNFQNYKAIIDADGFSWSSRFGNLLCYNSVILKIEPDYIDYYYYPVHINDTNNDNNDNYYDHQIILPWKHYIPIKGDLSDLIEKASYAVDPANEEHILSIIHNANEWCATKNTVSKLNIDVLDIWEKYVKTLDESTKLKNIYKSSPSSNVDSNPSGRLLLQDENWEDQWNQMKDDVYNGTLQMVPAV